ncbi:MAG: hypothetical protein M1839_005272 [Geoglossum umbratile]|nr:MAG: hypothetical protein M1839_005272 [Geoglossum umbratile]
MVLAGAYIPLSTGDEDHPESTMADQLETVTEVSRKSPEVEANDISDVAAGAIDINWRATTWFTTFLLTTDVLGPSSIP